MVSNDVNMPISLYTLYNRGNCIKHFRVKNRWSQLPKYLVFQLNDIQNTATHHKKTSFIPHNQTWKSFEIFLVEKFQGAVRVKFYLISTAP
jgi:hypothetical protein